METLTQTEEKIETKSYVLLESMDADAPIYQTLPGDKRVQIRKIPMHRPYLQVTFMDRNGKNRTLRYKASTDKIYQDEQIKDGILANEQFTQSERDSLYFRHGHLTTRSPVIQKFLEAHPENELFWIPDEKGRIGYCNEVKKPTFKLLDKKSEIKINNNEMRKRTRAATKIWDLNLEQAQEMLIRLNGSFFETPNDLEECQGMLIQWLDDTNEAGVDEILKDDLNVDESTTILIGKLINQGTLSFDHTAGKISKKDKAGNWIAVRDLNADYSMEEKKRIFADWLNTDEGKALKTDLEKDVKRAEKAAAKQN